MRESVVAAFASCTLAPAEREARGEEWRKLLALAESRVAEADRVRYVFRGLDEELRRLAAAEKACCSFFTFEIVPRGELVELVVAAPPVHQPALRRLFAE